MIGKLILIWQTRQTNLTSRVKRTQKLKTLNLRLNLRKSGKKLPLKRNKISCSQTTEYNGIRVKQREHLFVKALLHNHPLCKGGRRAVFVLCAAGGFFSKAQN